jgi:ABC-type antimicrobial peptide transport system permease subunit
VEIRFRVVGLLENSVLQGSLLIDEEHFKDLFPNLSGYRYFLIQTAEGKRAAVTAALEDRLGDEGFDVVSSSRVLEQLLAVQNTYLSTFQSLGALGLLLGTFGLAAIQLRSVIERRGELALLRATGFTRRSLARMVLIENVGLLMTGLAIGVLAALMAVLPHRLTGAAAIPPSLLRDLAIMLSIVVVVGIVSGLVSVRAALRTPVLPALRGD